MKQAYAVLGLLFLIITIGAAYSFNNGFIKKADTEKDAKKVSDDNTIGSMIDSRLELKSSAFENNGLIPAKYTCDGNREINPPLSITGVPESAKSLVLIIDDPDVPKQLHPDGMYDHWTVFNIPPPSPNTTLEILEGGPIPGIVGANSSGKNAYTGPCPPSQYEPSEHRYFFKLYALDVELRLKEGATKEEVENAMKDHILEETELIGRYKRQ